MSSLAQVSGPGRVLGDLFPQGAGLLGYTGLALTAAVLLLGGYVGYQAFRGYRRNDDRPVLFLGIGIVLVTAVRQIASTLAYAFVTENELALVALSFGVSIAGLLSIVYAFTRA